MEADPRRRFVERRPRAARTSQGAEQIVRAAVVLAGFVVVLAGLAMLALPGPGLLVIAAGLGVLALEFAWAERLLERTVRRWAPPATR